MLPSSILDIQAIAVGDTSSSKKRALEQAAQLLGRDDEKLIENIFERLLERERLGSTGLTGGVALPHARLPGIPGPKGAFIRLAEAVDFDSMDGQPTDLIFALLVPEEATEEHLQLLSKLAKLFADEALTKRLREADAQQALDLLTGQNAHHAA